jgi:predicted ATPase
VHVLYQNAFYASLTPARKTSLSGAVAEALLGYYADQSSTVASELAFLFEAARDFERAVDYFLLAAQDASRVFAHHEVVLLAQRGLELLKGLPETPERRQKELRLQITLGPALMASKGLTAPEVEATYVRVRELCSDVGEEPQLFRALYGIHTFYGVRGECRTALRLGNDLLPLAERLRDAEYRLAASAAVGQLLFWVGEFSAGLEHLERGTDPHHFDSKSSLALVFGMEPRVLCRSFGAWALVLLGCLEQALQRSSDALALAERLSHPFVLAWALCHAVWVRLERREATACRERAEALIALCREQGFEQILALGVFGHGAALVLEGRLDEGITQMREGLADYRAGGAELGATYGLALLADAHGKLGQAEEGLKLLEEALTHVRTREERFYEAEIRRLKGELLLMQGAPPEEVEACFRQALDIARQQQAKLLELRAAMSLSRLWKQGRKEEPREMLAEIYNWFTEGFDTADLQEAKALLEELSSPR